MPHIHTIMKTSFNRNKRINPKTDPSFFFKWIWVISSCNFWCSLNTCLLICYLKLYLKLAFGSSLPLPINFSPFQNTPPNALLILSCFVYRTVWIYESWGKRYCVNHMSLGIPLLTCHGDCPTTRRRKLVREHPYGEGTGLTLWMGSRYSDTY